MDVILELPPILVKVKQDFIAYHSGELQRWVRGPEFDMETLKTIGTNKLSNGKLPKDLLGTTEGVR